MSIDCSMFVDYVRMSEWNLKVRIVTFDVEDMDAVRRESQWEVFVEPVVLDSASCDVGDVAQVHWIVDSCLVVGMTEDMGDVVQDSGEFGGPEETDIDWHSSKRRVYRHVDMVIGRSMTWQESVNHSEAGLESVVGEAVDSYSSLDMLLVMHTGHRLVSHSPVMDVCPVRLAGDDCILENPVLEVQLVPE